MAESILELDADEWETEVLKSDKLTVVDFWHERCPWCLQLNPILEEIARQYQGKIKFVKVNVLKSPGNRELTLKYGIMSTPTLMFFHNGKPIGQVIGFIPKEKLKETLDDVLKRIGNA